MIKLVKIIGNILAEITCEEVLLASSVFELDAGKNDK